MAPAELESDGIVGGEAVEPFSSCSWIEKDRETDGSAEPLAGTGVALTFCKRISDGCF